MVNGDAYADAGADLLLLLTLLLLLMLVLMPMLVVLWELLGCLFCTCLHVFWTCREPLGASWVLSFDVFSCVWECTGASGSLRKPKDAPGAPQELPGGLVICVFTCRRDTGR